MSKAAEPVIRRPNSDALRICAADLLVGRLKPSRHSILILRTSVCGVYGIENPQNVS